jgi:biopolymer transport protein ExbD
MNTERKPRSWAISGLRTRYFPKSRIGQGLLSISPWVNLVLLLIFFVLIDKRLVLQPGVVIDLPQAPFTQGTHGGLVVVIMSVRGLDADANEDIVFFDDERFRIKHEDRMTAFRQALSAKFREGKNDNLVIQADRRVPYGTIMEILNMSLEVGIQRVNVAVRPL